MKKIDIDVDLDDIPEDDFSTKKKVNSKKKGNRYELYISNDLSKRFNDTFRRVPQSGAIVGGVNKLYNENLRSDAQEIFAGDIISPPWFPFCIEAKNYENTPKMANLLSVGDKDLDKWISQAKSSAKLAKKQWLICFKITKGRKSFCCLDKSFFEETTTSYNNYIVYKDTIILDYYDFMEKCISDFFETQENSDINNMEQGD